MTIGSRRLGAGVLAITLALAGAGCSSSAERCARSGDAQVCLEEDGGAYRTTGRGFQPGSDVHILANGQLTPPVPVDSRGRWPARGVVTGVLLGPRGQSVVVSGRSAAGVDVRIELAVPAFRGR